MNAAKITRLTLLLSIMLLMGAVLVLLVRQLQPLVNGVLNNGVISEEVARLTPPATQPSKRASPIPSATPTKPQLDQLLQTTVQPPRATPLPTATPSSAAPTPTQTPTSQLRATVKVDLANLRGGPGTTYAVVGQARAAQLVDLIARSDAGDWLKLCCRAEEAASAQEAWISAELVELAPDAAASLAQLPLATAPPPPVVAAPVSAANNGGSGGGTGAGLPGPGAFTPPSGTNPLTGLPLPGQRAGQRPLIVCVNNDPAARPQLGLGQADLVYEYLMEGYGITRFSAIFYGEEAGQIGPVRSARLINYYMGALYDAGLICSGASDQVRYSLKHEAPFPYMDIDLDDPSNSRYSVSIGSDYRTRLRTSTAGGRQWLAAWGVERAPQLRAFTFGGLAGGGAAATTVAIPYPYGSNSAYRYDSGSGRYLRSLAGAPHVDGNTGVQLAVENVIVQYVSHEATNIVEDSLGSTSIRLNLFGSNRALLFRDGQAFTGTWQSESRGALPTFYGSNGEPLPLKPGKSWISIVPDTYAISYQ